MSEERFLISFREGYSGRPNVTLRVGGVAMQFNLNQQDKEAADYPEHVATMSGKILAGLAQTGFQAESITPKDELKRMSDADLRIKAFGLGIDTDQSRTKIVNAITKAGTDEPDDTDDEE